MQTSQASITNTVSATENVQLGHCLQLAVDELHGSGKADVGVVEIAEAAKCTDGQQNDSHTTNLRKNFPMNVILDYTRQAPANTT